MDQVAQPDHPTHCTYSRLDSGHGDWLPQLSPYYVNWAKILLLTVNYYRFAVGFCHSDCRIDHYFACCELGWGRTIFPGSLNGGFIVLSGLNFKKAAHLQLS